MCIKINPTVPESSKNFYSIRVNTYTQASTKEMKGEAGRGVAVFFYIIRKLTNSRNIS